MPSPNPVDLDDIYKFALQLGKDAGKMLDDGWRARCNSGVQASHTEKDSAVDIVTQTDEGQLSSSCPF